jgi:hypothetical protein
MAPGMAGTPGIGPITAEAAGPAGAGERGVSVIPWRTGKELPKGRGPPTQKGMAE